MDMVQHGKGKTFEEFVANVKASCEQHAQRKNYSKSDVNGDNQLLSVMTTLGIHFPHAVGEIIYKCAEFLKTPRPVLMEKIAGWAWTIWRELPEEEK